MNKNIKLIIVNLLTLIRIIGIFFLFPIYKNYGGCITAIFSVFCYLTDLLDGFLARKWHVSTFLGSILDSTADKLFTIANFIVLITISPYTLIPIIFELLIVIIQLIKYNKNINLYSAMIGKIKTWVIAITLLLIYLVSDINNLSFLGINFINKVNNYNINTMILIISIPLIIFEILTLGKYIFQFSEGLKDNSKLPEIHLKLKKENSFKDKYDNFVKVWLNNEFYEEMKNEARLKDIRRYVRENR